MAYSQMLFVLFTVFNSIYYLNARYIGTPTTTANLKAVLRHDLTLKCEHEGDGDGGFLEWYKDGTPVSADKPGHYVVKQKEKESILIIKIFVEDDAKVKKWYVTTNKVGNEKPVECQFDQIALKPSPQGIETRRANEKLDSAHGSVRRNEYESVNLKCLIEPKVESDLNQVRWQFSIDGQTFANLPDGVEVKNDELNIAEVRKSHRGHYRCELNDVSFTVLLRVKDRLAALWPFLGFVGVVVVLVIVISIFEKRQKSNKRTTANDDDEQDQANDPLVRTTTKSSDNDNKKRAVKA